MTPARKRELISEVADEFWPARIIARLAPNVGDAHSWSATFFPTHREDEPADKALERMMALLPNKSFTGVHQLSYSYLTKELDLYVELYPQVELSDDVRTQLMDIVLDSLSETYIREVFTDYKPVFFEMTDTTPADWRM